MRTLIVLLSAAVLLTACQFEGIGAETVNIDGRYLRVFNKDGTDEYYHVYQLSRISGSTTAVSGVEYKLDKNKIKDPKSEEKISGWLEDTGRHIRLILNNEEERTQRPFTVEEDGKKLVYLLKAPYLLYEKQP